MAAYNDPNQDNDLLGSNTPFNARVDRQAEHLASVKDAVSKGFMDETELKRVALQMNMTPQAVNRIVNTDYGGSGNTVGSTPTYEDPSVMDYRDPNEVALLNELQVLRETPELIEQEIPVQPAPISISETKQNIATVAAKSKEEMLVAKSDQKKAELNPEALLESKLNENLASMANLDFNKTNRQDFLIKYLDTGLPSEVLNNVYFQLSGAQNLADKEKAVRNLKAYAPRTAGEVVSDTALSIAKTPGMIGETIYGLANFAAGGNLENATGIGALLTQSREWLNSKQSSQTQVQKEIVQEEVDKKIQEEMAWLDSRKKDGANSVFDIARVIGSLVKTGALEILDNPAALQDSIVETSLAFLIPAGFGAAVRKQAMNALSAADRAAVMAGKATGKIAEIERNVKLASLAGIAAMEAGNNAIQGQQKILNMTEEQLMQYGKYRDLLADGVNPQLAKESLAADHFFLNYGLTALGAGTISKITGSDKVAAMFSKNLSKSADIITRPLKTGAVETIEEFGQSGFGVLSENIANVEAGKDGQKILTPEILTTAGQGAVTGGIAGGGTTAIGSVLQGSALAAETSRVKLEAEREALAVQAAGGETAKAFNENIKANGLTPENVNTFISELEETPQNTAQLAKSLVSLATTENINDPIKKQALEDGVKTLRTKIGGQVQSMALEAFVTEKAEANPDLIKDKDITDANVLKEVFTQIIQQGGQEAVTEFQTKQAELMEEIKNNFPENFSEDLKRVTGILDGSIKIDPVDIDEASEADQQTVIRRMGSTPSKYTPEQFAAVKASQAYQNLDEETKAVINASEAIAIGLSVSSVGKVVKDGGQLDGQKWRGINTYLNIFNDGMVKLDLKRATTQRNELARWFETRSAKLTSYANKPQTPKIVNTIAAIQVENKLMQDTLALMDLQLSKISGNTGLTNIVATQQSTPTQQANDTNVVEPNLNETETPTNEDATISEQAAVKQSPETTATPSNIQEAQAKPVEVKKVVEETSKPVAQASDSEAPVRKAEDVSSEVKPETIQAITEELTEETNPNELTINNESVEADEISDNLINELPDGENTTSEKDSWFLDIVKNTANFIYKDVITKYLKPVKSTAPLLVGSDNLIAQTNEEVLNALGLTLTDANEASVSIWKETVQTFQRNAKKLTLADVTKIQNSEIRLFAQNNLQLFSVDKNGKSVYNQRVITALATAYMNEVAGNSALSRVLNTDKDIKEMLGLKEDDVLDPEMAVNLRTGFMAGDVAKNIGKHFLKIMGASTLKTINPSDYDTMLASAGMNALVLGSMIGQGRFYKEEVITVYSEETGYSKKLLFTPANPDSQSFQDLGMTYGFATKFYTALTGIQPNKKLPKKEKPTKVRANISSRNMFREAMRLPKKVLNVLLKHSQIEQTFHGDMINNLEVLSGLTVDQIINMTPQQLIDESKNNSGLRTVAGIKKHTLSAHVLKSESEKSANEAIEREILGLLTWIQELGKEGDINKPFYFEHAAASNMRWMLQGNVINPQSSKFIRHMIGPKSFLVKVTENSKAMKDFKKAVIQAFDAKSATKLKYNEMRDEELNITFNNIVASSEVAEALKVLNDGLVLREGIEETLIENEKFLEAFLQSKEHPSHAYHALVGIAAYLDRNSDGSFYSSLPYEVDGKTNGATHSILGYMEGGLDNDFTSYLNKVGIYTKESIEDGITNWGEFAEQGGKDHYVFFGSKVTENIEASETNNIHLNALVSGSYDTFSIARNLIKQPLMVLIYGAGIENVTAAFGESVIDEMYDTLSSEATELEVKRVTLIQALNKLLPKSNNVKALQEGGGNTQFVLTKAEKKALMDAFQTSYKPAIEAALEQGYPNFVERRRQVNTTLSEAYRLFKRVWIKKYYEKLNEINLALVAKGEPIQQSLNKYQEAEVVKSMDIPSLDTFYVKGNKSGIVPFKTKRVDATESFIQRHYKGSFSKFGEQPDVKHKADSKGFVTTVKLKDTPFNSDYVTLNYFNLEGKSVRVVLVKKGAPQSQSGIEYNDETNTFTVKVNKVLSIGSKELAAAYPNGMDSLVPPTLVTQINYEANATGKVSYDKNRRAKGAESTTLGAVSESVMLQDPGVSGAVLFTHSQDGANQLYTMGEFDGDALNVHDAYYYPLGKAEEGARITNKGMKTIHREGAGVITNASKYLKEMYDYALKEGVAKISDGFVDEFGNYVESESERIYKTIDTMGTMGKNVDTYRQDFIDTGIGSFNQFADRDSAYTVENELQEKQSEATKQAAKDLEKENEIVELYADNGAEKAYYTNERKKFNKEQRKNKTKRKMGSSADPLINFNEQFTDEINTASVRTIYDNIEMNDPVTLTPEHKTRLDSIVDNLITPLVGSIKLAIENTTDRTKAVFEQRLTDTIIKLQRGSQAPSIFDLSQKETLVHELVHAIMQAPMEISSRYKRRMEDLFDTAKKYLKPTDLLGKGPHAQAEIDAAERFYDYIFNNEDGSKINPYAGIQGALVPNSRQLNNGVHEFIAFGLTNQIFINALNNLFTNNPEARKEFERGERFIGVKSDPKSTFFTKAISVVNEFISYLAFKVRKWMDKVAGLEGKQADQVLYALATKIAFIENNAANKAAANLTTWDKVNNNTKAAIKFVAAPVAKGIDKALNLINKNVTDGTQKLVSIAENAKASQVGEMISNIFNSYDVDKDNLIRSIATEAMGRLKTNRVIHDLLLIGRRLVDTASKDLSNAAKTAIRKMMSRELTKEESASLTRVALYADLSAIYKNNNMSYVEDMVGNETKRTQEIQRLRKEVNKLSKTYGLYMTNQADLLAELMITGVTSFAANVQYNAENIANLNGVKGKPNYNVKTMTEMVDQLTTLLALQKSNQVDLNRVAALIKEETAVGKNNGVGQYLDLHKYFKDESTERLFEGNTSLQRKGYVREITNPNLGFKVVDYFTGEKMKKDGYEVFEITREPNGDKAYMVVGDSLSLETYTRGVISTTGKKAKGTTIANSYLQIDPNDPDYAQAMADVKALKAIFKLNTNDLMKEDINDLRASKIKDNNVQPLYDNQGNIVDFRYQMSNENRVKLLERADMFDATLGYMLGSVMNKLETKKINDAAVAVMGSIYYSGDNTGKSFIKVHPNANDPDVKEAWNLMPEDMKQAAKKVFNEDAVYVRTEDFRLWFGQRKKNLSDFADWLDKKSADTILQNTTKMITDLLRNKYVGIGEQVWKDMVVLAKERIVILSGIVLAGNIVSNTLLLGMSGMMNPLKIMAYQKEGYEYLRKFQQDTLNLQRAIIKLTDNTLTNRERKNLKGNVQNLQNRLAENPVQPLMDRGAYQSIIDDVSMVDEQFSYSSKLERKLEPITDRIPDVIKDLGATVFMTKSTASNQFLRDATAVSDFMARYALHKFNTKDKGISFEDSFDDVMDSFINYEAPTHAVIGWANDVGLAMFTKFFIRIQKVLLKKLRDNPAGIGLWLFGLDNYFGNPSDIFDTGLSPTTLGNRLYGPNPVIDELTTIPITNFSLM